MSIQPNTTCVIYRTGHAPPAAPDAAAVPCCFISCFDLGREHGEKEAQQFRFTARMWVDPSVDIRDNFNSWTGSASSRDTVYIPDQNGIGYNVNFVERLQRGLAADSLCAYLDRLAITWPYPGPAVISVSPTGGPLAGGTSVVVTGRGFTGTTTVHFGSTAATSFTVNSDTQITAISPAESAGTVDVTVTTSLGTSTTSSGDKYSFIAPPAVTNVNPSSGSTSGGTSVTITGTSFTAATAVKFGATAASTFAVNSSTQITATSPAESAGTVDITVTTPYGTSATSSADQFTFSTPAGITIVQSGMTGSSGTANPTINWPNPTTAGNTLVYFIATNNSICTNSPAGGSANWTCRYIPPGLADFECFVLYGASSRSTDAFTLTGADDCQIAFAEVAGLVGTIPDLGTATNGTSTTASPGVGSNTSYANEIVFGIVCGTNAISATTPSGFALLNSGTQVEVFLSWFYQVVSTTGNYNYSSTLAASTTWGAGFLSCN